MYRKIFKSLNIITDETKPSKIESLINPPLKEKGKSMPSIRAYKEDAEHQADLLFLPDDNGYRYVLTVVDAFNREADAEPLKNKKPETVLKAIKQIWKRNYLDEPNIVLKVDKGNEFLGQFKQYFKDNKIILHQAKTNRHRTVALAEYLNFVIGKAVGVKQANDEAVNDEDDLEWVDDLPKIIKTYNEFIQMNEPPDMFKQKPFITKKQFKKNDLVYVMLDYPENRKGKKIDSKFRAGDMRFNKEPNKIKDVMINPGQPILYTIDGIKNVAYTYEQLRAVKPDEQDLKASSKKYNVEKILAKKRINNKVHYKIKWEGYPTSSNTWEPRSELIKTIPDIVKQFDKSLK